MKHGYESVAALYQDNWLKSMENESHRGAALIVGEVLSVGLELLLKQVLPKPSKDLFKFGGPIGDSSGRVAIAHALGCIDDDVEYDLTQVRRIRNEFAHGIRGLDFDSTSVADKIDNFRILGKLMKEFKEGAPSVLSPGDRTPPMADVIDTNRKKFLYESFLLLAEIDHRARDNRTLPTYEQWKAEYESRQADSGPTILSPTILSQLLGG